MSCGYAETERERSIFADMGDGFYLAGLLSVYSAGIISYSRDKLVGVLDDGIALVDRDLGLVNEYGHRRFPAEFETKMAELSENADMIRFREFLRQSRDAATQGRELPTMPENIRGIAKSMFDKRLARVRCA